MVVIAVCQLIQFLVIIYILDDIINEKINNRIFKNKKK